VLTDAGLVERSRDPNDGRAILLQLTNLGRRRVRAMRRELLKVIRSLLDPLPEKRRAALGLAFDELSKLLETSVWLASSKDGLQRMR
jgi:DNA-binding MarR family transcriptional regulator